MYLILIMLSALTLFVMLTWVVVTVGRICFSDGGLSVRKEPQALIRQYVKASGGGLPVGAREIRDEQRQHFGEGSAALYEYAPGESSGLPVRWIRDMHLRCN